MSDSNKHFYNFPGNKSVHAVRDNKRGSGEKLMVDENINYELRDDLCTVLTVAAECVFVEIPKNGF